MTPQLPAISVREVRKSYGDLPVLRGVSLEVSPGGVFALLGSNGAGKTTLVKILATLIDADGGRATVAGADVGTHPGKVREQISLTGQFSAVDEVLTGSENLVMIARLRHLRQPVTVARAMIDAFSLAEYADRRVATYSGGMRRRLDIAMSLVGNPAVVFLDEPTTGLDPQARLEVWASIRRLALEGTAVLLTTQSLEEAEQLADRIGILHQGRIVANGTFEELKELIPPAKVEYVQKQPSLEDVFLSIIGKTVSEDAA